MSVDDAIMIGEIDKRIRKSKRFDAKDWQTTKKYLYGSNPFLREQALHWITLVNQPEYHDEMIAGARHAMQEAQSPKLDPMNADIMQAHALRVLWKKDASDWWSEYQRLQALPKKGMMTRDFLEEIRTHQR